MSGNITATTMRLFDMGEAGDIAIADATATSTGLFDRNGHEICVGDYVSIGGNITADDSMGPLPNGWTFWDDEFFQVVYDDFLKTWSLSFDLEPDSPLNAKYIHHALALLHNGCAELVNEEGNPRFPQPIERRNPRFPQPVEREISKPRAKLSRKARKAARAKQAASTKPSFL